MVDEKNPPQEENLMAQLRDLCSCTKLAAGIKSMNNLGNCIQLFGDDQCSRNGVQVAGGRSSTSDDLNRHGINDKKSVNACQEPPHCLQLTATMIKFEVTPNQDKTLPSLSQTMDVQMATKGTFIINGDATVTQEYIAKKIVQETTIIKRNQSLSAMHKVNVSASVQFENRLGLPFIDQDQTKLISSFSAGYNFTSTSSQQNSEEHFEVEAKMFQATQKIEIPPCTSYEISSFVKFTEKYPLQYAVYVNVSGMLGNDKLSADHIQKRLTDLQWISNLDEHTVYAKGKSTAAVDFGMEAFINGRSMRVSNCSKSTD